MGNRNPYTQTLSSEEKAASSPDEKTPQETPNRWSLIRLYEWVQSKRSSKTMSSKTMSLKEAKKLIETGIKTQEAVIDQLELEQQNTFTMMKQARYQNNTPRALRYLKNYKQQGKNIVTRYNTLQSIDKALLSVKNAISLPDTIEVMQTCKAVLLNSTLLQDGPDKLNELSTNLEVALKEVEEIGDALAPSRQRGDMDDKNLKLELEQMFKDDTQEEEPIHTPSTTKESVPAQRIAKESVPAQRTASVVTVPLLSPPAVAPPLEKSSKMSKNNRPKEILLA